MIGASFLNKICMIYDVSKDFKDRKLMNCYYISNKHMSKESIQIIQQYFFHVHVTRVDNKISI